MFTKYITFTITARTIDLNDERYSMKEEIHYIISPKLNLYTVMINAREFSDRWRARAPSLSAYFLILEINYK